MTDSSRLEWRPFVGDPQQWDDVARRHGSFFHTSGWLDVLSATQPATIHRLGLYANGTLIGILPLGARRLFPLTVAASPMIVEDTPYLGIACEAPTLSTAIVALDRYARTRGWHFVRLMQRTEVEATALPSSCAIVAKHTHVLDLSQSTDAIFKGMEGRCRTAIRKAEKSGVTVTREATLESLDAYYDILSALYQAQGMPTPNSHEFFRQAWQRFGDKELLLLIARLDGQVIAGAVVLVAGRDAYYLSGASRDQFNHLSPNNLVQWTAIQAAKTAGAEHYDFVGSDIERLAKFKKSFGGQLSSYSCVEWASSSWVRYVREKFPQAKSLIRNLRKSVRTSSPDATPTAVPPEALISAS